MCFLIMLLINGINDNRLIEELLNVRPFLLKHSSSI